MTILNFITDVFSKLWYGKYSLGKSFWGFFIFGTLCAIPAGMIFTIPFALMDAKSLAHQVFWIIYGGYRTITVVGVWRSGNALKRSEKGTAKNAAALKVFGAKLIVCIWVIGDIGRITDLRFADIIRYLK